MSKLIKNTWDAVNDLRGDLSNTHLFDADDIYLHYCIDDGDYTCNTFISDNDDEKLVCAIAEFEALVEEMVTNFGESKSYHNYKINFYGITTDGLLSLTKETEPDYTSLEFWKDAPKGKNFALFNKRKGLKRFFTEKPIKDGDTGESACWLDRDSRTLYLRRHWKLIKRKRPQSTPTETPEEKEALDSIVNKPLVYTQEMSDNGVLPSVGMRFLCGEEMEEDLRTIDFKDKEVEVIGISKHKNRDIITFHHNTLGIGCGIFFSSWVKPVDTRTKKEKAIDELRDFDNSICNDTEWYANFLQAIIDGKITGVKWVGE